MSIFYGYPLGMGPIAIPKKNEHFKAKSVLHNYGIEKNDVKLILL